MINIVLYEPEIPGNTGNIDFVRFGAVILFEVDGC